VFLTLWFKPSMQEVIYNGPYAPLQGVSMTEAYESTLHISFDIRGGLLMRQIHHRGSDPVHGIHHPAHAAHLLHRRVPQAP